MASGAQTGAPEAKQEERMRMVTAAYEHPWVIRFTHWLNAVAVFVLAASGLRIVLTDPRADLRASLEAILQAELADNDCWLNLVRLEMDVYTDNERALRLYKNFDFEIEGRKRLDAFRGGSYIDSYILARLRPRIGEQGNWSAGETAYPKKQNSYAETLTRVPESPVPSPGSEQEESKTNK